MSNYAIKRLLLLVPVMFGVSIAVFLLVKISPGDPAVAMLPPDARTPENINAIRERLLLNEPLHVQYVHWLGDVLQGDLGKSYRKSGTPVTTLIEGAVWPTVQLSAVSFVIGLSVAIPLGVVSAVRKDTWIDNASRVLAFGGISMPAFWVAIMMMLVFAQFWQGWFGQPLIPTGGYVPIKEGIVPWFQHIFPPALVLGTGFAALTMRLTRSAMVEVLNEDYIRTAKAKGVRGRAVVMVHALRNALIPVVTVMGMQIGFLLNGAVVIETVFQWPGIGRLLYKSVVGQDMPTIQGVVLFIAFVFVVANLCVDLLYAYLDPRIDYE